MSITIKEGMPCDIQLPIAFRMSDEAFFEFAVSLPDVRMERDSDGNIIILPPVSFETGNFEAEAAVELAIWNRKHKAGMVFSSQTGFVLPNSAIRGPDASWISKERVAQLPAEERKWLAHICPDFVIEIRSASDRLPQLQAKMEEYMENGARLGFLIDLKNAQAFAYRADGTVTQVQGLGGEQSGEGVLPGFVLPLGLFAMRD